MNKVDDTKICHICNDKIDPTDETSCYIKDSKDKAKESWKPICHFCNFLTLTGCSPNILT